VKVLEALPEQEESSCSYVNCGLIVPSHFTPLASPAMLRAGLKMIFDRKGALCLSPTANIGSIGWFLNFAKAARTGRNGEAEALLFLLNETSRKLYEQIKERWQPEAAYQQKGLLMAAVTRKGFEEETALSELASRLGLTTRILDRHQLTQTLQQPRLNLTGAVWYGNDAAIDPRKHLQWLKNQLARQDVPVSWRTTVTGFLRKGKEIKAIHCGNESFYADEFVIAAGVGSAPLARILGLNIPVIPGKGYSTDLPAPGNPLGIPLILSEAKAALNPLDGRIRIGSGMEFNGRHGLIRTRRIQAMLDRTGAALPFLDIPPLSRLQIHEGFRPLSPDGLPFLGRTAAFRNLLIATGHAMMGMSLGPVSGKLISDQICGNDTGIGLSLVHPDRYSNSGYRNRN
jgi:D-amino-acid dehydrogenase